MKRFILNLILPLSIYCVLTLPHIIAFSTFDLDTGEYYGYVYPFWLIVAIGILSPILSTILMQHIEIESEDKK